MISKAARTNRTRWSYAVLTSATFLVLGTAAQGGSIDFDTNLPGGLTGNAYCQGCPVSASSEVTDQFESLGAIFSTSGGASFAALIDLGSGHAVSGTNGIGSVNTSDNVDYTKDLDIFLVVPGTLTPAVTDSISIQGDEIPSGGQVYFTAYDTLGNLVASGSATDTAGGTYALSASGIHEFRLHSANGDVAYDNLVFDTPTAPSNMPGVPEPASLVPMGLALAAAWVGKRFRR